MLTKFLLGLVLQVSLHWPHSVPFSLTPSTATADECASPSQSQSHINSSHCPASLWSFEASFFISLWLSLLVLTWPYQMVTAQTSSCSAQQHWFRWQFFVLSSFICWEPFLLDSLLLNLISFAGSFSSHLPDVNVLELPICPHLFHKQLHSFTLLSPYYQTGLGLFPTWMSTGVPHLDVYRCLKPNKPNPNSWFHKPQVCSWHNPTTLGKRTANWHRSALDSVSHLASKQFESLSLKHRIANHFLPPTCCTTQVSYLHCHMSPLLLGPPMPQL